MSDIYSSAAQGLLGGAQLGMSMKQARQQRRNQEWEKDWQVASQGAEIFSNAKMPAEMRLNAFNNGVVPVWNKYKRGNEIQPLSPADIQNDNQGVKYFTKGLSGIVSDKKMDPQMKMEAMTNLTMNYYAQKGRAEDVAKTAFDLVKPQVEYQRKRESGGSGRADSPSAIEAQLKRKFLSGGVEALTPEERQVGASFLRDPDFTSAMQIYNADPKNFGKSADQRVDEITVIADTLKRYNQMNLGGADSQPTAPTVPVQQPGQNQATVKVQTSDGRMILLPSQNLEAAKQRDPGLKVIQ